MKTETMLDYYSQIEEKGLRDTMFDNAGDMGTRKEIFKAAVLLTCARTSVGLVDEMRDILLDEEVESIRELLSNATHASNLKPLIKDTLLYVFDHGSS